VRLPLRGRGPASVDVASTESIPTAELLASAVEALRPCRPLSQNAPGGSTTGAHVLVDAQRVNPRGRRFEAYLPGARRYALEFGSAGRFSSGGRGPSWLAGSGPNLSWPTIGALRTVGAVTCGASVSEPAMSPVAAEPVQLATLLVELAMTGVPLAATNLPDRVAANIAPDLRAILAEPLPGGIAPLDLELRSVRQRRAALRDHSHWFATQAAPAVSAVLATRRPELLPTVLSAILSQTYPNLELVLCLHGVDLPARSADLLARSGRSYQVVTVPADEVFGTALEIASSRAQGSLLTKFDDDDTYGPEHVWDLVLARHYSGATLIGKGAEFVYLEDADRTVRRWSGRPESDDSAIMAGGTMLLGADDLAEVGGWPPVPRSVDRGLVERIHQAGAVMYRTHPLGYVYHRRAGGHTWEPGREYFLKDTYQSWTGLIQADEFGTAATDDHHAGPTRPDPTEDQ
jgi:hypothetical protein